MEQRKKKVSYERLPINKKIRKTFLTACIVLAAVSCVVSVAVAIIVSAYAASLINDADDVASLNGLTGLLVVISLVVLGWATFFVVKKSLAIYHRGIFKPLTEFMFEFRKSNEGLEDSGIVITEDTEDEIAMIDSVYFNMTNQLKTYIDDIMKLSGLTEKFENSAHFDSLTGVYNRRRFTELIQSHSIVAAKKNEPTFICMLDLDFFKKVNDTYGHAAGDEVLKVIAERVKNTVRPYDLFGRYGGEEFIMFLSAPDSEIAINFAERIRMIVAEAPVHFEGTDIPVTTSIGVAQMAPNRTFEQATKVADEALYKAKQNGRNRVELV